MNLYILRHAIAEERSHEHWPDDSLRPLTTKGKKRMHRIAVAMRALGLSFDVIYTSSYTRARETADIVVAVFNAGKKLRETGTLAVDGDPGELVRLINSAKNEFENVLLVGHEPYLGEFISTLLVGDSSLPLTMKKGGICKLSVGNLKYGACASLEWLLPPSVSSLIGNSR
ncbi:MAG: phosphohistidine phosphatase SixA [Bacteroidetes bacterium]|nr:phosphohistidine phosphatase SixA [Bacteroidota bacterium]MCW5894703.1 phosphohistidine phosphatase SixA [Bacteroidota bacterium]